MRGAARHCYVSCGCSCDPRRSLDKSGCATTLSVGTDFGTGFVCHEAKRVVPLPARVWQYIGAAILRTSTVLSAVVVLIERVMQQTNSGSRIGLVGMIAPCLYPATPSPMLQIKLRKTTAAWMLGSRGLTLTGAPEVNV